MNTSRIQPDVTDDMRGLISPAERDLPADRQRRLRGFVMSQIQHREQPMPQWSRRRRLAVATAAMTAVAAAVAVAITVVGTGVGTGVGGGGRVGAGPSASSRGPAVSELAGRQILLAAATTAELAPAGSGTYWYVKIIATWHTNGDTTYEYWTNRDSRTWFRAMKTGGQVVDLGPTPFRLGWIATTFEQLQKLPTTPETLTAWIADAVLHTGAKATGADASQRDVLLGLISLISALPAPPKVRAAAFQAIAAYPDVVNLGPVSGGVGLQVSTGRGTPSVLVVDPATSKVRETDFYEFASGGEMYAAEGHSFQLVTDWTDQLSG
jgi:hypothetical protein